MARKPTDKQLFKMKNEWLGQFYEEVKPKDFYRAVFPEGSFEREGHPEDEKCNGVLTVIEGEKARNYIVFDELNMSGVMPIIFASAMVSIPGTIGSFLQIDQAAHPFWYAFFHTFNYTSLLYIVIYLLLILAFNYFYVAIQYNPVEIANNLRRNNGSIPGFRPGKPTSDFLTRTLNKITLMGAIFLAAVAVLPIILGNLTGMSIQLGGTSLLIVVGVALDTTRSLDSFMTMRNHKGFLG